MKKGRFVPFSKIDYLIFYDKFFTFPWIFSFRRFLWCFSFLDIIIFIYLVNKEHWQNLHDLWLLAASLWGGVYFVNLSNYFIFSHIISLISYLISHTSYLISHISYLIFPINIHYMSYIVSGISYLISHISYIITHI